MYGVNYPDLLHSTLSVAIDVWFERRAVISAVSTVMLASKYDKFNENSGFSRGETCPEKSRETFFLSQSFSEADQTNSIYHSYVKQHSFGTCLHVFEKTFFLFYSCLNGSYLKKRMSCSCLN